MLTIPVFFMLLTSSRKYNWIDACQLPFYAYCSKEYETIAAHQNSAQSIEKFHHIPHWCVSVIFNSIITCAIYTVYVNQYWEYFW